jgi:hypothetical protein
MSRSIQELLYYTGKRFREPKECPVFGLAFIKPFAEHRQFYTRALEKKWSIFKKIKKVEMSRESLTRPNCLQALGHSASAEAKARVVIDSTYLYMTGRYCFY